MRRVVITSLVLAAVISCTAKDNRFVSVKGHQFIVDGKPYYFLGTNLWYGCMLGQPGPAGNRPRLMAELDHLKSMGIDNLRVMGASEGLGLEGQIQPAIQPEPGRYNETLLRGLDFLMAEMGKRKMHAVVFLNNYWEWTGGMSQYMSWVTGDEYPSPMNPKYGYWGLMKTSGLFYNNEPANKLYRDYIRMLLNRKNTVTGRRYRDDPAIMAWQLANEPRPYPDAKDRDTFYPNFLDWVEGTAKFIKSIDSHHLVSTGNEGLAGCLWGESDTTWAEKCYRAMHSSPAIDYLTMHLWPLNWSWYDPLKAEATYPLTEKRARQYVQRHIRMAEQVGKPLTLEEFGLPRDRHEYSPQSTTNYRDHYYSVLFEEMYQSARSGSAMAGSNVWGWGGDGMARDQNTFIWQKGDDYTGDPPQEPQGRNSIFITDKNTIGILRKYAELMNSIK